MAETEFARSPAPPEPIRDAYAWALARLRAAFPDWEVVDGVFDWGRSYAVAVSLHGRRTGLKLEHHWIENWDEGVPTDDPDEPWGRRPPEGGWRVATYSLNTDPAKEATLDRMIERMRRTLTEAAP